MRHVVNPVASWYEATAMRGAPHLPLRGKDSVEACVVGGGLAGLSTAVNLQLNGIPTILLEGSRLAAAASGRNGGFVSNGFALSISNVAAKIGHDAARTLYDLSREGSEFIRATISKHDPSLIMGHGWRVALRHRDDGSLKSYAEMMRRDFDEPVDYSGIEETRRHLDTPRYFESICNTRGFHIHPLRYALLLARIGMAAGLRIHENSRVLATEKSGTTFLVRTAEGEITARHVVHCTSAIDTSLHAPSGCAVLPVATYVAVTEPLQQQSIRTKGAIADTRRAGDYYRLIDEGRILWGGRITTRISEPSRLAERMKGDMLSIYPKLGNPRIDHAWAGLMGYAIHMMPVIGRDQEGQWFATAFGGHGLNTTAMAGLLLARAIATGDDSYRRFSPFAPTYAFGQLGRLGVQGSYWWMQFRDRIDEARSAKELK